MTVTTLDPQTALIVVDLQNGMAALSAVPPMSEVIQRAAMLADAFRRHGLPIVLVNVAGGAPGRTEQARHMGTPPAGWIDIVPELKQQPDDAVVTKHTWGAFTNTDLAAYLKDRAVTQVVIVGVATSIGVESTARQAHEFGFNVTLAIDAMTDRSSEAHANSITLIFPRLGETGSVREIIELLDKDHE